MKTLLVLVLLFPLGYTFAEQDSYHSSEKSYILQVEEHRFNVQYNVDANIIAMAVDQELDALLIGLENANDSVMTISLEHKLIHTDDGAYAVLINGIESHYKAETDGDITTLRFFVPAFSEEVEIIGTHVIPEFPPTMLVWLAMLVFAGVILYRKIPNIIRS